MQSHEGGLQFLMLESKEIIPDFKDEDKTER